MSLMCPSCDQALKVMSYEGVKVALCGSCKGFFLGRKNLKHIEETKSIEVPMELLPKIAPEDEISKDCPKCKRVMVKRKYGELGATTIDFCEKCRGIWLDPGELEQIQMLYEAVNEESLPVTKYRKNIGFNCPKCQVEQEQSEQCISCGIYFAKYKAIADAETRRNQANASTTAKVDQLFDNIKGFEVSQEYHLTEIFLGFERANVYHLKALPADAVRGTWHIQESNAGGLSILGRQIFGLLYTFTMELFDERRNKLLQVTRARTLYFHAVDIWDENGRLIGRARRRFSYVNRLVSIEDPDGRVLMSIVGPIWQPWTFRLYHGVAEVGSISKKWSGSLVEAFSDADNFSIRFKETLGSKRKRLAMGGLMLVESLYFEGNKGFLAHFSSTPAIGIGSLLVFVLIVAMSMIVSP